MKDLHLQYVFSFTCFQEWIDNLLQMCGFNKANECGKTLKKDMKEDDIIKENKVVSMSVFLGFWLFPFGSSSHIFTDPFPFLNQCD